MRIFIIITRLIYGDNGLQVAEALNKVALYYMKGRDYTKALVLSLEVLQIRTKTFEEQHLEKGYASVSDAYCNVGLLQRLLGRPKDALENYFAAMRIRLKYYPNRSVEPIQSIILAIGCIQHQAGNFSSAHTAYNEVLKFRKYELGALHADTVIIEQLLGELARDVEIKKEEIKQKRRVLSIDSNYLETSVDLEPGDFASRGRRAFFVKNNDVHGRAFNNRLRDLTRMLGLTSTLAKHPSAVSLNEYRYNQFNSLRQHPRTEIPATIATSRIRSLYGESWRNLFVPSTAIIPLVRTTVTGPDVLAMAESMEFQRALEDTSRKLPPVNVPKIDRGRAVLTDAQPQMEVSREATELLTEWGLQPPDITSDGQLINKDDKFDPSYEMCLCFQTKQIKTRIFLPLIDENTGQAVLGFYEKPIMFPNPAIWHTTINRKEIAEQKEHDVLKQEKIIMFKVKKHSPSEKFKDISPLLESIDNKEVLSVAKAKTLEKHEKDFQVKELHPHPSKITLNSVEKNIISNKTPGPSAVSRESQDTAEKIVEVSTKQSQEATTEPKKAQLIKKGAITKSNKEEQAIENEGSTKIKLQENLIEEKTSVLQEEKNEESSAKKKLPPQKILTKKSPAEQTKKRLLGSPGKGKFSPVDRPKDRKVGNFKFQPKLKMEVKHGASLYGINMAMNFSETTRVSTKFPGSEKKKRLTTTDLFPFRNKVNPSHENKEDSLKFENLNNYTMAIYSHHIENAMLDTWKKQKPEAIICPPGRTVKDWSFILTKIKETDSSLNERKTSFNKRLFQSLGVHQNPPPSSELLSQANKEISKYIGNDTCINSSTIHVVNSFNKNSTLKTSDHLEFYNNHNLYNFLNNQPFQQKNLYFSSEQIHTSEINSSDATTIKGKKKVLVKKLKAKAPVTKDTASKVVSKVTTKTPLAKISKESEMTTKTPLAKISKESEMTTKTPLAKISKESEMTTKTPLAKISKESEMTKKTPLEKISKESEMTTKTPLEKISKSSNEDQIEHMPSITKEMIFEEKVKAPTKELGTAITTKPTSSSPPKATDETKMPSLGSPKKVGIDSSIIAKRFTPKQPLPQDGNITEEIQLNKIEKKPPSTAEKTSRHTTKASLQIEGPQVSIEDFQRIKGIKSAKKEIPGKGHVPTVQLLDANGHMVVELPWQLKLDTIRTFNLDYTEQHTTIKVTSYPKFKIKNIKNLSLCLNKYVIYI
ncbi:formin FRM1 [Cardiosporidium cionae]|uniref:Formin FRM1 n=1 Tax=Cardiosporidium cionae TaxID=476202 RepID=A0ABQ7JGG3_9APIC|nr:formin FRM1 [Cardiosporidium cionae]|eukprot:KAF8823112.1 formin FRM1 [Cardiosporidium cionae]